LRGWKLHPEIRKRDESTGEFAVVRAEESMPVAVQTQLSPSAPMLAAEEASYAQDHLEAYGAQKDTFLKIYPYAVSKGLLERVIKTLNLPAEVVRTIEDADAILALRSYARAGAKIYSLAEAKQIPVYV